MANARKLLTAFFAGELDPHLDGRVDTEAYNFGLSVCENFVPLNEGPLVKRQGFTYVRDAAPTAAWLSAFRFSIEQEYVLEWSDQALRFFTDDARIEDEDGNPYQVAVPYSASEASKVCKQQSYNRLYLNHAGHAPASLLRTSSVSFSFETLALENGPFLDPNTQESRTIAASASTGSIILTAAGHQPFTAGHVGSLIRLEAKDFADVPQWEPQMKSVQIGDKVRNEGKVYEARSAGTTGQVQPTHTEGTYYDGQNARDALNDKGPYGVRWRFVHDRFGVARITAINGASSAQATVERRLPDAVTGGTYKWALGAFSEAEGWPHLVTLYKGRRVDFKELDVVGSVVDDYGGGRVNYATFSSSGIIAADLGFRRTMAIADPPLWVTADRKMLLGTATQEVAVGAFSASSVFSGENIEAEPQSFYGCDAVFPVQIGTETIFVERGGRRLRGADYDFGRDRYDAPDMTAAARNITAGGIVQLAFQRIPHSFVHGVRRDGQIVLHPKTREAIKGFSRTLLGGGARALSAVCAVGEDGTEDRLWILIERENAAGQTVREIWQQAEWRELGQDPSQSIYLDCATRFTASAGDGHFTGFVHLAGATVTALVDGIVVRDLIVADDGSIELPENVVPMVDYTVVIGLPYAAKATTMRPHINNENGGSSGLRQRLVKLVTRLVETLGLKVQAPGQQIPEELVLREGGQRLDEQIPLFSGDTDGLVEAEFDRDGRATWISDDPLPAIVSQAILNLDVSWRDE